MKKERADKINFAIICLLVLAVIFLGGLSLHYHGKANDNKVSKDSSPFTAAIKEATGQGNEDDLDVVVKRVSDLKAINDVLVENIKETDGWLLDRDQLVRALSNELPVDVVVAIIVDLATSSKSEYEARRQLYLTAKVFKIEKDPLRLNSKEVKIRNIGEKISQKEVGILIK